MTFTCSMGCSAYRFLIVPSVRTVGLLLTVAGFPATVSAFAAFLAGLFGSGMLIKKCTACR